ncbi:unnamed protein product [Amaranthus hypochondriacus]
MGDSPNYHVVPPSFNEQQTNNQYNLSMLYCGFFVVATAGLILAIYHCIAMHWCSDHPSVWVRPPETAASNQRFHGQNKVIYQFDSIVFKYKKGEEQKGSNNGTNSEDCVVCLCGFEEGEDIRKLVRCKHSFHAQCIDMWLYSHIDCPLCRAPVAALARPNCSGSGFYGSANPV